MRGIRQPTRCLKLRSSFSSPAGLCWQASNAVCLSRSQPSEPNFEVTHGRQRASSPLERPCCPHAPHRSAIPFPGSKHSKIYYHYVTAQHLCYLELLSSLCLPVDSTAAPKRKRLSCCSPPDTRRSDLQATAGALLKGRRPSYRESLLQVRDRLSIKCPSGLTTPVRPHIPGCRCHQT